MTTFKSYGTRLHMQNIYCRLTGCRLVANEFNYKMNNIKSQYVDAIGKACNSGFHSLVQRMLMIYIFDRLDHPVKRSLYISIGNR